MGRWQHESRRIQGISKDFWEAPVASASRAMADNVVVNVSAATAAPGGETGEEKFNSAVNGELHPLLNPVILANIFGFCSPKQLLNCRQVCKTWHEYSLPVWRSTSTIKIMHILCEGLFVTNGVDNNRKTVLSSFLDYWEASCLTKPHRKFQLEYVKFGAHAMDRFWYLVGPHMTSLELYLCDFTSYEEFWKVVILHCPNLKSLTFYACHFDFQKDIKEDPQSLAETVQGEQSNLRSLTIQISFNGYRREIADFWMILLSHFPSLTSIKLIDKFHGRIDASFAIKLLEAIHRIRQKDSKKLPLLEFEICPGIEVSNSASTQELLSLSRAMDLSLVRSLKIRLDTNINLVKTLIQEHCQSLTKIEDEDERSDFRHVFAAVPNLDFADEEDDVDDYVNNDGGDQPEDHSCLECLPCCFPFGLELPNLTEMVVSDKFVNNLQFSQFTPNLKKLKLLPVVDYFYVPPETRMFSEARQALPPAPLLKLKEFYSSYVICQEDLLNVVRWMPNVEVLTMNLNNAMFAIVCRSWRKLVHLHVLGKSLTDEGVTGRVRSSIQLRRNKVVPGGVAIRPNITLLRNLTCFEIQPFHSRLTDVSAFHGFLELPNLQRLLVTSWLGGAPFGTFGEEAGTLLRSKIPNCTLWEVGVTRLNCKPVRRSFKISCDSID